MPKKNKEYDQNVIAALKALPVPLITYNGSEVRFDVDKREETIFEHIANKDHHIHVKDIAVIPSILLSKGSLKNDRNGRKFRAYIGKRGKNKERLKYLKIVTELKKNKKESVVTIYPVKNNDWKSTYILIE